MPVFVVQQAEAQGAHDHIATFDPITGRPGWHQNLASTGVGFLVGPQAIFTLDDHTLTAYQASTGKRLWQDEEPANTQLNRFIATDADLLLIDEGGTDHSGATVEHLVALDAATGHHRWVFQSGAIVEAVFAPTEVYIGITGAGSDANALAHQPGVVALSRQTGATLWSSTATHLIDVMQLIGHQLFVFSDFGVFAFDPQTGMVQWHVTEQAVPVQILSDGHTLYVLLQVPGTLVAITMMTGVVQWSTPVLSTATSSFQLAACVIGTQVIVADEDSLSVQSVRASDGVIQWSQPAQGTFARLMCSADTAYLAGSAIRAVDGATGVTRWQLPSSSRQLRSSGMVLTTTTAYVVAAQGDAQTVSLYALDPHRGTQRWVTPTTLSSGDPLMWQVDSTAS